MVLGFGVIGTTYGYLFQKAGHTVEHFIREGKRASVPRMLDVKLFDGRHNPKGEAKEGCYQLTMASPGTEYDFILVSVSAGKLEGALETLWENRIQGTLLLFNGIWEGREELERTLTGWEYILGYPVAGGSREGDLLDCVVFDHVMLEGRGKAKIQDYDGLLSLFQDADMSVEIPFDMLEWIWLHMAINAGVITTAGKYGDVSDTAKAAETVMDSAGALSEAVLAIRETAGIIASRGVNLKNYANELLPYKIPSRLAGIIMRRMFAKNELTRRIMQLHSNMGDLLYVCHSVYECGRANGVDAPVFYQNYESILEALKKGIS